MADDLPHILSVTPQQATLLARVLLADRAQAFVRAEARWGTLVVERAATLRA
eukprot:CAMPEP_0204207800 /NCGR_PEP_ID=MMETSP0361-20130328/72018_1 /ASSEMBLY_ACC=CAM_ASM_000343 /TAXON_ID=268821 /ORGANISM="Scrippsiella Hangoei, Strain SHTV-5" /LENGTH=51 /DNA_ID=CAMNT_0051171441 /DNA_START=416 /DNA_END=571 /DNA_ORIENTATION=+